MHLTSSPVDWYVARAGGIAAYLLLSVVVSLGLATRGRAGRRWPKFALEDVHRFGGLLVGAFVALHVITIAVDSWLPFTLTQLVVPFTDRYRPLWIGLGIVAAELLLALAITNHYRDRLSYRFWRRAHYLNFVVWAAATVHGIASGTDRSAVWLLAVYTPAVTAVCMLIARRAGQAGLPAGALGAFAGALVLVLALGPFRFQARPWNAVSFRDALSGRILVQRGATEGILSMAGDGTGAQRVLVRADLLVRPKGKPATAFQLEYMPSGSICRGSVRQVRPTGFDAICRLPGGGRRFVSADWRLRGSGDALQGKISAHE